MDTINDDHDKGHDDIKYVSLDRSENGYTTGLISLDIPPSKKVKDNSIIENRFLINNHLTKSRISSMNIIKDDGTIITGYAIAHPKRNKDFHAYFKEISPNEHLVNNYSCALQKDILAQGMMFISLYHICFHSNIFGWVTNVIISFSDIIEIEKRMTAYVIPNAIQITTKGAKYLFTSFLSRDSVYELLMKIRNYNLNNEQFSQESDSGIESDEKKRKRSDPEVKPHREIICDCLKNNEHFDNLILDTKFKGSVEKIYNLLYTSGFNSEFLREKNDDVNIGEWTKDNNGKLIRQSNYTKHLNQTSPKATKCYLKDEVLYQDLDRYVTIMTTANAPDVPSGGTFEVKTRTCIMWADSDTTRMIITSTVNFSRYSLFKSIIEKGSLEGQLIHYKELEEAIHKYITQNLAEFDSETASILSDKPEDDNVEKSDDGDDDVKKNPIIKEKEKMIILNEDNNKIRDKLRISIIETIVIIVLLLTLIFNIYVLTSIRDVNAKVELIEGQNEAVESLWNDKFKEYL